MTTKTASGHGTNGTSAFTKLYNLNKHDTIRSSTHYDESDDENQDYESDENPKLVIDGQEYILSSHKTNNLTSKTKLPTTMNDDSVDVSNLISQFRSNSNKHLSKEQPNLVHHSSNSSSSSSAATTNNSSRKTTNNCNKNSEIEIL